jgi:hypothetical protein
MYLDFPLEEDILNYFCENDNVEENILKIDWESLFCEKEEKKTSCAFENRENSQDTQNQNQNEIQLDKIISSNNNKKLKNSSRSVPSTARCYKSRSPFQYEILTKEQRITYNLNRLCSNVECVNERPKESNDIYCCQSCKNRAHNLHRKGSKLERNKKKENIRKHLESKIREGLEMEDLVKLRKKLIKEMGK